MMYGLRDCSRRQRRHFILTIYLMLSFDRLTASHAPSILGQQPSLASQGASHSIDSVFLSRKSSLGDTPNASAMNATGVSANTSHETHEAVTLESWVHLKESIASIRSQVRKILAVKDDVGMLQEDLQIQERLWHRTEHELEEENGKLKFELDSLRTQLSALGRADDEVLRLQGLIKAEELSQREVARAAAEEERQRQLERSFYSVRQSNLSAILHSLNDTMETEVSVRHEQRLQLETDAVALNLRKTDLEDRVNRSEEELTLQRQQADAESKELKRQIKGMQDGLVRIKAQVAGTQAVTAQKVHLQRVRAQVQQEVSSMVAVQQEQSQLEIECGKLRQVRAEAKCAEEKKTRKRKQEIAAYCQPVDAQLAALKQLLRECQVGSSG
eukprot:TRINITY_DN57698_c0_g1_i1.p1 TRINITY_DN57698_c0_g1~~TRINITY_DN57698_c0_g1_i1.p1  ORF type:complete len:386 (-),score=54.02 TRINITY_DN57698_c0_g1_i1:57-1214(-)